MRIVLNAPMFAERLTCDIVVVAHSAIEEELGRKNLCGGEDFFAAPSADGTPFQVYVQYPKRSFKGQNYDYAGDQLATNAFTPVLLEYNLFTVTAAHITYDSQNQTVSCPGIFAIKNEFGDTPHLDSMIYRLRDSQAVQVP
jgi:hypothetical protein